MGTRTNVVIEHGETHVILYRHWDGYLAETGADLARKLREHNTVNEFLQAILAEQYEADKYRPARPIYELTTGIHGDIEYLYRVQFARDAEPMIGYRIRNLLVKMDDGFYVPSTITLLPLPVFVANVNAAIREQNARLEELRRTGNYLGVEPSPEL